MLTPVQRTGLPSKINDATLLSQLLLHPEVDLNESLVDGDSLLLSASKLQQSQAAQLLIKHRANVSYTNAENDTPLLLACEHGMEDVVAELLDAGATEFDGGPEGALSFDSSDADLFQTGDERTARAQWSRQIETPPLVRALPDLFLLTQEATT